MSLTKIAIVGAGWRAEFYLRLALAMPERFEIVGWVGLLAPAKTPRAIIDKLYTETLRALQSREVGDRMKSEGAEIVGNSPAEFAEFLKADLQRWARVIKRAGAKID